MKFLVPSDPRFLALVRAAIGELGTVYGLPEHECRLITMAIDEALANIIRHAYRGKCDRPIEIHCEGRADRLEFTLLDQGEPPAPESVCEHPLDEVALSGRGTHIIRMVMDEIHYQRVARGNELRLSRRISVAAANAEDSKNL